MKTAVLVSCFDWYDMRLKPIRDFLVSKGYKVTVFLSDYDHISKQRINKKNNECCYIRTPEYKKNISVSRILSHLTFAKRIKERINTIKPDLLYVLTPPNSLANVASQYKKKHPGTRFIIDIIDLWPESMPFGKIKKLLPLSFWVRLRDNAIKTSDYVFTECNLYKKKLSHVLDLNRTSTLYLFKNQTDEEKLLIRHLIEKYNDEKRTKSLRFAYLGSMNSILDIEGICAVIKNCIHDGYACELYAIGDGNSRLAFEDAVRKLGCETYFYGALFDEKEKIKILTPCDFAFNMMKGSVSVGLTIKSLDYLSYGLPLINNIKGDTWAMIKKYKLGFNVGDVDIKRAGFNRDKILSFFDKNFSQKVFLSKIESIL
jgi:hypothetical protein